MKQKFFGAYLDCARGGVLTVERVKDYIDALSKIGYDFLELYLEDLIEVDDEPLFGYMRGRYTKAELRELTDYAASKGMELVPSIQALAHLEHIFRWPEYKKICDTKCVLMVGEDRTYQLIENMFKTCRECFDTDLISVNIDEANGVGLGQYLKKHGYRNVWDILKEHMARVKSIADKYGFTVTISTDLFFSLACGEYYPPEPRGVLTDEIISTVPEGVVLDYWDFFCSGNYFDKMWEEHKRFGRPVCYEAAAMNWVGYTPHNHLAFRFFKMQMEACRRNGVEKIIVCEFGDDGNEATVFTVLPALFYAKRVYDGVSDWDTLNNEYKELFGLTLEEAARADYPADYRDDTDNFYSVKNLLFNDPFTPVYNDLLPYLADDYPDLMDRHAAELDAIADNKDFGYIFKMEAALCRLMKAKVYLSDHTRKAYAAGKQAVTGVLEEYDECLEKLEVFRTALMAYWFHDYKGNGFEIQAIRLGGLKQRLSDCKELLSAYAAGEIERLHELEEPIQIVHQEEDLKDFFYAKAVSVNSISHFAYPLH